MSAKGLFEKVWTIVTHVPEGQVVTYGQIAVLLGNPRAARTVGWALHSTPDLLDIPWHRVINSAGRISTDCGEHSPTVQRQLLEQEGIVFDARDRVDLDRFQWRPPLELIESILGE
ncbi:MGMT family protein [candidate division KSB1 bacterium]|nr:MGMT family protein [candidate division KSB1 bacterium]RQW01575.1 MAG: MGMT family protein [candidate division KSB1 bacterium]